MKNSKRSEMNQADIDFTLQECLKLKARLALELQSLKDERKRQLKEFESLMVGMQGFMEEYMANLWGTLDQIQARFRVDATILNLIKPEEKA